MTENVLEISVLWQLCIRLIYRMAFECELRYKNNIQRKTEILFKFVIFNINYNLIFVIFLLFISYLITRPRPLNITLTKNLCRPLDLNRNMIWPFLAVRSSH